MSHKTGIHFCGPVSSSLARHLQRGVAGEAAHPRLQTPDIIGIGLSGGRIGAGGNGAGAQQRLHLLALQRPRQRRRRASRAGGNEAAVGRDILAAGLGTGHRNLAVQDRACRLGKRRPHRHDGRGRHGAEHEHSAPARHEAFLASLLPAIRLSVSAAHGNSDTRPLFIKRKARAKASETAGASRLGTE